MYSIEPVAICHSPFKQKFAIPRQPRLAKHVKGRIELLSPYNDPNFIKGIKSFSHVWLLFLFHENIQQGWKPTVRPPRLGGNQRIGVFATRSTFRPNSIGQSAVKLIDIETHKNNTTLLVQGLDLLDQTPIIDIKPYLPYSDSIPEANSDFAQEKPVHKPVLFSSDAVNSLQILDVQNNIKSMIEEILTQDPRPAYKQKQFDNKIYHVHIYDFDIHWTVDNNHILVLQINRIKDDPIKIIDI